MSDSDLKRPEDKIDSSSNGEGESDGVNTNELILSKKILKEARKFKKAYLTYSSYNTINELDKSAVSHKQEEWIDKALEDFSKKDYDKMLDKAQDIINDNKNDSTPPKARDVESERDCIFHKLNNLIKKIDETKATIDNFIKSINECKITKHSAETSANNSMDDSAVCQNIESPDSCQSSRCGQNPTKPAPEDGTDDSEPQRATKELEEAKGKLEEAKGKLEEAKKERKRTEENKEVEILKSAVKQCDEAVDNYAKDAIGIELTDWWHKAVLYCASVALVLLFGAPLFKQIGISLLSIYNVHLLEVLRQAKLLKNSVNLIITLRKILLPMFTAVLAAFTTVSDWKVKRIDALLEDCDDTQKKLIKQSHYYVIKKSWPGVFMALTVITTLCTAMSALLDI